MTDQSQSREQIVSQIVEESKAILSYFVVLLAQTTLIWYIVNNTMEYAMTWQFVFGALLILRIVK